MADTDLVPVEGFDNRRYKLRQFQTSIDKRGRLARACRDLLDGVLGLFHSEQHFEAACLLHRMHIGANQVLDY